MKAADMFDVSASRMTMAGSIDLTLRSLRAHAEDFEHWAIAWSGGKDSSAALTFTWWAIASGQVQAPKSLTVLYADTRLEMPPLAIAAGITLEKLRTRGVRVEVVTAPMDDRFLVYLLGRGVPPPSNTFRWCTPQIKVEPMEAAFERLLDGLEGRALMLTGVRVGESAARDERIAIACGKDGAECGQGWFQEVLPNAKGIRGRLATLAPLLHWRVCHVWEWLRFFAPAQEYGGWPTAMVAEAYGGDEAEELNNRTGCIACPLTDQDKALSTIVKMPGWEYLAPLLRIKPIYRALRLPEHRLRKPGFRVGDDGSVEVEGGKNKQRMGPLTFEARLWALNEILAIQVEANASARQQGRPEIDLLNPDEEQRIRELIALKTWPQGWDGNEPRADMPLPFAVLGDGRLQPELWGDVAP
jgi:DNA sulfur modification protein DndC